MKHSGYATSEARLDAVFAALANPTRRAILQRLARGAASVNELAEPFAMTQPAVSKHLKILERANLISRSRDAQRRPCRLRAKPMEEANRWLEGYRRHWGILRPAGRVTGRNEDTGEAETIMPVTPGPTLRKAAK